MSQYVYQRRGGPLVYWTPGAPPRGTRAAEARSLGQAPQYGANFGALGCGGDCGCAGCGKKSGLGGGYPEYGGRAIAVPRGAARPFPLSGTSVNSVFTPIKVPTGAAMPYRSSMGTVAFVPGAPEPLTDAVSPSDVDALIDPYPAKPSLPIGTILLAGLGLALAWPHIKKMAR